MEEEQFLGRRSQGIKDGEEESVEKLEREGGGERGEGKVYTTRSKIESGSKS